MKTKGRTNFVYKKWEEFYGVTLEDKFLQIDSDLQIENQKSMSWSKVSEAQFSPI